MSCSSESSNDGASGGSAGSSGTAGKAGGSCATAATCPAIDTRPADCAVAVCVNGVCGYTAEDADNDGYKTERCQSLTPDVSVELGLDCDDADPAVNPGAWDGPADGADLPNACNDDLDNDCSGALDDASLDDGTTCTCVPGETAPCAQTTSGLPIDFPVLDEQQRPVGVCRLGSMTCLPNGTWGECSGAIAPQPETCDGSDNDCDGVASRSDPDTLKITWLCDADSDDHLLADGALSEQACEPPSTGCAGQWLAQNASSADDCDDTDAAVYAGATETCDGKDNDCDGVADDNAVDVQVWSYDADADFYRNDAFASVVQCTAPTAAPENCSTIQANCPVDGWHGGVGPLPPGDCDDNAPARNPSATRDLCDGTDYNCDGSVVSGCSCQVGTSQPCGTHPEDGIGECRAGTQQCIGGAWGDCLGSVGPSAEVCGVKDNDCDGIPGDTDPSTTNRSMFYCDADGDAVLAPGKVGVAACAAPGSGCAGGAWRENPDPADFSDCDDSSNMIRPGAAERCNGIDDNCDKSAGATTPAAEPTEDGDGDGFAAITAACTGGTLPKTDCYDGDARVKPTQMTRFTDGYCSVPSHPYWCGTSGFRNCLRVPNCGDLPGNGLPANYDFNCDSLQTPFDRFEIGMTEGLWALTCSVMVSGGASACAALVPEYVQTGSCGQNGTHRACGVSAQSGGITLCGPVTSTKLVACR